MEYKQIEMPAMKIVGLGVNTSMETCSKDCMPIWMDFMKVMGDIENKVESKKSYGVSFSFNQEAGTFRYLAGLEVSEYGELKGNLEKVDVAASNYLVFEHIGKLDTLSKTYEAIMPEVIASGKQQGDLWLEVYDERFKLDSDESVFEIWVPVK